MKKQLVWACLSLGLMGLVSGCTTYYKVVNPDSNKTYYTDKLQRKGNGVVQFKDGLSQSEVTLAQSEINEIPKAEYKANVSPK